jgi:hypothetical protein
MVSGVLCSVVVAQGEVRQMVFSPFKHWHLFWRVAHSPRPRCRFVGLGGMMNDGRWAGGQMGKWASGRGGGSRITKSGGAACFRPQTVEGPAAPPLRASESDSDLRTEYSCQEWETPPTASNLFASYKHQTSSSLIVFNLPFPFFIFSLTHHRESQ